MLATPSPQPDTPLLRTTGADRKVFEYLEEAHRQYLRYLDEVELLDWAGLRQNDPDDLRCPPRIDLPLTYDLQ